MPRTVSRNITGLDSISHVLQQLPVEIRGSILRDAVSAAAEPVKEAAKRNARRSVRTGALYASIEKKVVTAKGLKSASATAIVGPSRDYFRKGGAKVKQTGGSVDRRGAEQPSRYAHLVEFGHHVVTGGSLKAQYSLSLVDTGKRTKTGKPVKRWKRAGVKTAAKGKSAGWVAPRPFMRPAFLATQSKTLQVMTQSISDGIERARRNLAKGAA
jgi:HK97 gp10 family phage protein